MASAVSPSPKLEDLAKLIAINAHTLQQDIDLQNNGVGSGDDPSKDDTDLLLDGETIKTTRAAIVDGCRAMIKRVMPADERLKDMDKHNLTSLRVINHYSIASKVPRNGKTSFNSLSQTCNIAQDILTRILRQAMTYDVFREPQRGYVAHTPASRALIPLSPLLSYQLDICLPSTVHLLDHLQQKRKGEAKLPFQIAHQTTDTWWDFASNNGNWMETYGHYQDLISQGGDHDASDLMYGFHWRSLPEGTTVIDIGGGSGDVGIDFARVLYPRLHVQIQDLPSLQASFEAKLGRDKRDWHSHVTFLPHSFFEPQPPSKTVPPAKYPILSPPKKVFLLRHILHDWPLSECHRILQNLKPSMGKGTIMIVCEQVMPSVSFGSSTTTMPDNHVNKKRRIHENKEEDGVDFRPGSDSKSGFEAISNSFKSAEQERVMRALDLQMMVQYGSQERTREDWEDLFAGVGMKIVGIKRPKGSADTVMEVALDPVGDPQDIS
ncbi:MAG: hypothetical protein Q9218_004697 [Villophora microphyllina]